MRLVLTSNKLNSFSKLKSSFSQGGVNFMCMLIKIVCEEFKILFRWTKWSLHNQGLKLTETHMWTLSKPIVWSGPKNSQAATMIKEKLGIIPKSNWIFHGSCGSLTENCILSNPHGICSRFEKTWIIEGDGNWWSPKMFIDRACFTFPRPERWKSFLWFPLNTLSTAKRTAG